MRPTLLPACALVALVSTGVAQAPMKLTAKMECNGDKYFIHFKGTSALKNGAPVSGDCTWKFTGGTGKLEGIKGKGTCKGTFQPDGKAVWEVKGEYRLAAAAGK